MQTEARVKALKANWPIGEKMGRFLVIPRLEE
jgi:hypothetical protein